MEAGGRRVNVYGKQFDTAVHSGTKPKKSSTSIYFRFALPVEVEESSDLVASMMIRQMFSLKIPADLVS